VSLYRDDGVVLRVQKLGEADRIITLLTRREGKVRAVGKGVRRTTSKFGSKLEPFSHVDVQLYTGRTLDIITQAESISSYGSGIVTDYGRYTAGTTILETADRLTEEREPSLRLFLMLVGALRTLSAGEHAPSLVLDAFLLRAMSLSGWEPVLDDCARCGNSGPHRAFSVPAGGVVCSSCRPGGAASASLPTLDLMRALLRGDWFAADTSEPVARRDASGLVAAHLQWHLERGLRSLRLVDRR
jgi:DNA repair protein RecO (recombination protein O)